MATKAKSRGATVCCGIDNKIIGPTLHILENYLSIHLVDRAAGKEPNTETWWLRSDEFPSAWNGKFVYLHIEIAGIEFRCDQEKITVTPSA